MRMLLYHLKERYKHLLPVGAEIWVLRLLGWHITRNRRETNRWLRQCAPEITGDVISLGSGSHSDKEGCHYRDYFTHAASYTTAGLSTEHGAGLQIDSRSMREI